LQTTNVTTTVISVHGREVSGREDDEPEKRIATFAFPGEDRTERDMDHEDERPWRVDARVVWPTAAGPLQEVTSVDHSRSVPE
jgi:hypothetical protein